MPHIDYYFSTISPFTYLAGLGLEETAGRHGATIAYKPLNIMQLFARTGGVPPKDRHISRQEYRLQDLRRTAARRGLTLNLRPAHWPTDMAPSSCAIIAAQEAGGGDPGRLVHSLTAACWAEERDIAEAGVIRDCLAAAGFDPALAGGGLASWGEAYARNLEDAVSAGVFGAPFYVVDSGERFWGQDRLADLDLHLSGRF